MLIYTRTKTESAEAFKDSDAIQEIVKKYYPEGSYLVGETPSTQDIKSYIVKDYENVNILSLAGVFLVVMMSFKSAVMPILVIIPIEVAIFIKQLPGKEKDAAEEKGMRGGHRGIMFLNLYFRFHHHAGRIYRIHDFVHNCNRGSGTPDRTGRTVQPCIGADSASTAAYII